MTNEHGLERKMIPCGICEKTFHTTSGHVQHLNSVHFGIKLKCDQCDAEYSTRTGLQEHIKGVHQQVSFQCPDCPKKYSSKGRLQQHRETKHGDGGQKCDLCERRLTNRHMKVIHKMNMDGTLIIETEPPKPKDIDLVPKVKKKRRRLNAEKTELEALEADTDIFSPNKRTAQGHVRSLDEELYQGISFDQGLDLTVEAMDDYH